MWRNGIRAFDQPGQHDHAPCPVDEGLRGDPLHNLLEMPDVRGPDVDERVRVARDGAGVRHLRMPPHCRPDLLGRGRPAAEQLDVGFRRPAERRGIDTRGETGDRPAGAQPVHPPLDGGGRKADLVPDHCVACAGIGDQRGDDARVNLIQAHRPPSWHRATPDGTVRCRTERPPAEKIEARCPAFTEPHK